MPCRSPASAAPRSWTSSTSPTQRPGPGQQLYDVATAGVNFADTHQIENSYLAAQQLPLIPGAEFVGTPVGGGQRVVGLLDGGGYAEKAVAHDFLTWPVPDGVSDEQALAVVLQGATAWHLLRTSSHLAEGESVVVIAGAGGVGSLAVQLARRWGAGRVIATASSPEKRALAEELGARRHRRPRAGRRRPEAVHRRPARGQRRQAGRHRAGDDRRQRLRRARCRRSPRSAGWSPTAWPAGRSPKPIQAGVAHAEEPRGHRLLAGPLHGAPRDARRRDERAAADGGRRHAASRSSAAATRCPTSARRTRTCWPAAPPASSSSTPAADQLSVQKARAHSAAFCTESFR